MFLCRLHLEPVSFYLKKPCGFIMLEGEAGSLLWREPSPSLSLRRTLLGWDGERWTWVWWLFHVPIGTGISSSDIPSLCTHKMCSPLLWVSSHHKLHPRAAERGGSLTEGQCPGLSFSILTFQYLSLARTRLLSFLRAYLDLEVIHSPI